MKLLALTHAAMCQPTPRRRSAWRALAARRVCWRLQGCGAGGHGRPDARPAADHRRPLPGRLRAAAAFRGRDTSPTPASTCCWARRRCARSAPSRPRRLFERSLALQPDSVEAHLGLGRAYLALGDYASAKIEFETVLRFDDLPPDLQQQAEIYAEAAQGYAAGQAPARQRLRHRRLRQLPHRRRRRRAAATTASSRRASAAT